MKTAIYPGSFNPFHEGHFSIVKQIHPLFDKIIVAVGNNPEKPTSFDVSLLTDTTTKVEVIVFDGLLKDACQKYNANVIIRGLRNTQDFEYEKTQQYWNEDLGIGIPTLYVIADRNLTHISSSAIRSIRKIKT